MVVGDCQDLQVLALLCITECKMICVPLLLLQLGLDNCEGVKIVLCDSVSSIDCLVNRPVFLHVAMWSEGSLVCLVA